MCMVSTKKTGCVCFFDGIYSVLNNQHYTFGNIHH